MRFSKKIGALLLAVAASAMLLGGCSEKKAQMGYFNNERVMKESPKMEAIIKEANEKLQKANEDIIKMEVEQGPNMKPEELEKKRQEGQVLLQTLQSNYGGQLRRELDVAIDEVAKAKKLDAVVANEPGGRIVIMGGVDITEDLIQKLR